MVDRNEFRGGWDLARLGGPTAVALAAYLATGLTVVGWGEIAVAVPITPAVLLVALPVPLAVVFGRRAVAGVAAGVVLVGVVTGGFGAVTLVAALAHGYAVLATDALLAGRRGHGPRTLGGVRPARLLAVTGAVVLGVVGILAWGRELFSVSPFFVSAALLAPASLAVALSLTAPLVWLFGRVKTAGDGSGSAVEREPGRQPRLGLVVVVTVVWIASASAFSFAYRIFEEYGASILARRGLESLQVLGTPVVYGSGGSRLLVVLGAIALSVLGWLVAGDLLSHSGGRTVDERAERSTDGSEVNG